MKVTNVALNNLGVFTLPETNELHLNMMVGRLVSFWDDLFSGAKAMLVSGCLHLQIQRLTGSSKTSDTATICLLT